MNETKEHILLVATRLFLQKSFKEVTMNEIVDKTGLSKGAFYYYFKSKEQLFFEVIEYFMKNIAHDYESYSKESLYKFYQDYARGISALSEKHLEKYKGDLNEGVFTMNYFSLIFDALKLFPEFRERMITGFDREIEIWAGVIKNAREKGEIKSSMTDDEIAKTFMFLSDGVAMHMIMRGYKIEEMIAPFLVLWDKLYEQLKA